MDTQDWNFWGDLVDGKEADLQEFDFRFGDENLGSGSQNDWYHGVVLKAYQDTLFNGAKIRIIGGDRGLFMKSKTRTRVWKDSFSDIISSMGREYGFNSVDIEKPREDHAGYSYWQHGENDWDFLKGYMKLFVSGERGLSDYEMWIEHGNILKFQPPGKNRIPTKVWSYSGEGDPIKRLRFVQRKQALQMFGGISIRGYAYDPDEKEVLVSDRNYSNYPENSALGAKVTLPQNSDTPSMTFSTGVKTQEDLDERVAARIGDRHRNMYMAIVDIFPDTQGYNVGDIVSLSLSQNGKGKNDNTFSGNYIVEQRRGLYTLKENRMRLLLSRVGANIGEDKVPGVSMNNAPVPATNGDGRDRKVDKV